MKKSIIVAEVVEGHLRKVHIIARIAEESTEQRSEAPTSVHVLENKPEIRRSKVGHAKSAVVKAVHQSVEDWGFPKQIKDKT